MTGKLIKRMWGPMDIVRSAKWVVVLMQHRAKDGSSKLAPESSLPLTDRGVLNRVITDLAVLDITESIMWSPLDFQRRSGFRSA